MRLLLSFMLWAFFFVLCLAIPVTHAVIGDAVANCTSVAASGTLDIRPTTGIEWVIHVISSKENWQLKRTDGTDTTNMAAVFLGGDHYIFVPATHLTNGNWIQVVNQNGAAASVICYDGVRTK